MPKIRVYELAKDLNLTNKVLVNKLREMDLLVKSHMSTLDAEMVEQVKAEVFGTKPKTFEVEETRVQSTVIRRRRKTIKKKKVADDVPPEPVEAEPVVAETVEPVPEPPPSTPIVKKPKKTEASAKIIQKAAAIPDEPPPTATKVEKEAASPEPEQVSPPVAEAAPKTETPDETHQPDETPDDTQEKALEGEAPEEKPLEKPVAKATPPKSIKKKKQDTPARIIKRAPPQPTSTSTESESSVPGPVPVKDFTRKKDKAGKKEGTDKSDRRFFKRKISFKRKSVVEGADLYSNKKSRRKGRRRGKKKPLVTAQKTQITTAKAIKRRIKIDETIIINDLAKRMGVKVNELIVQIMNMGVMATVNQSIDFDTAVLLAAEFDYEVEKAVFEEESVIKKVAEEDPENLKPRPPVVTIMGHVDHGKTSLLDVIRKTRVTDTEAGGITQHIGAYCVPTANGEIVFLDTPGHEAFTSMRARGASVTDLVILVVAADDGVMPQTQEAINHARAADVPIIVAINKIDKANADPERVQRELAEAGLTPEDWGGDTIFMQVSAKMNQGIDELLEMIQLQAEMLELLANPDKLATGHVIEAKLDTGRGPVATVLIREGTLRAGDPVVCGIHHGKVRSLINNLGQITESAGPAMPVEILGLSGVPMAGDELVSLADEKGAKQVGQHRMQQQRSKELAKSNQLSLENVFEKMQEGEIKTLNLIIKADVQGSVEAMQDALVKLSNEEVKIEVSHSATGTIIESDVSLATVSNAIIIGFNVRPTPKVQVMANEEHVDMRFYSVIYDVIKDVKNAIVGMMDAVFEEHSLGRADVREVFQISKVGAVAGCFVTEGRIERGKPIRVIRDGVVVYEGNVANVRRFKDDVKVVKNGYECGITVEKFNDIKAGDVLECFEMEEIAPQLS
jgi:translation initiation factor IF-2